MCDILKVPVLLLYAALSTLHSIMLISNKGKRESRRWNGHQFPVWPLCIDLVVVIVTAVLATLVLICMRKKSFINHLTYTTKKIDDVRHIMPCTPNTFTPTDLLIIKNPMV